MTFNAPKMSGAIPDQPNFTESQEPLMGGGLGSDLPRRNFRNPANEFGSDESELGMSAVSLPPPAERAAWGGKLEFILTCVGFAVGLGNVWRFPFLCYKNGGGAFLLPYFIMLALVGLPLFFFELCLGQFASLGPISVWKINPVLKGLGIGMVSVSWLINIYYNDVIAQVLLFLFSSMQSEVPWATCEHEWNTINCTTSGSNTSALGINASHALNVSAENQYLLKYYTPKTPSQEFYDNYILQMSNGIEDLGNLNWRLTLCLLLAWGVVYVCLIKGISSLGKVVYFTALFPYVMLTVMLIRGVTLPGAANGIAFYLKPDFTRLSDPRVWSDAATQIFYSLSACCGGLIAMSSYNKFHNNCYQDAVVVSIINCATSLFAGFVIFSVLGFMAHETGREVSDVAAGGAWLGLLMLSAVWRTRRAVRCRTWPRAVRGSGC